MIKNRPTLWAIFVYEQYRTHHIFKIGISHGNPERWIKTPKKSLHIEAIAKTVYTGYCKKVVYYVRVAFLCLFDTLHYSTKCAKTHIVHSMTTTPTTQSIHEAVQSACERAGVDTAVCARADIAAPAETAHGDYTSNIALIAAKEMGEQPRKLAERIAAHVAHEDIARVEVAGPGFLNIFLTRHAFLSGVRNALQQEQWGGNLSREGEKVLVEHTQPNPFKPFHIGHLMTNTLGEAVARLYEYTGAEVRRANYQGDVGLHVAKCLWGLAHTGGSPSSVEDLGRAYVAGNSAYEEDAAARAEIVSYNKQVYAHAPEIADAYETGRRVSLAHFEALYTLLGTHFDYYFFESDTQAPGRALVKEGFADGVFIEGEGGAVVYEGEREGLHTRVFLTREGLPTYEAKELGLAQRKAEKWDFDISITTTAVEQKEFLRVVYAALANMRPELAQKMRVITHGMMLLTTGKMSSRKGNVITGEALLREMIARAKEKVAERDLTEEEKETGARAVGVAAIKYTILRQKSGKNITFDSDAALSFEGASGPYLQYAYTRARSVLRKGEAQGVLPSTTEAPSEVVLLERLLLRFPDVVLRAQQEEEPHHITTYLTELASEWSSWYARETILDGTLAAPYKLALAELFARTMKNGLYMLGIEVVERM
jgi:arginyl-tRNA synthetase